MRWFFQRILDRLLLKSTIQAASEFEAQLTLEMGESRAVLLRKAHELEQERVPGFEQLAADLRAQAAKMGGRQLPAGEVLEIAAMLREENLREPIVTLAIADETQTAACPAMRTLPSPATGKKRGRPRKVIAPQTEQDQSGRDAN